MLDRAAELLARSADGDVSTRAVCQAAGVTQPVLYRLFGDKDGLLAAVVDHVWDQYLTMKRRATPSADPLGDLRAGWDSHLRFALDHPHAYRLLFGAGLRSPGDAADEAMAILRRDLERLAAQGRLRVPPDEAARLVLAANSGVALALLLRPAAYPDAAISRTMRDAVYRSLLIDEPEVAPERPRFVAATTLRAQLDATTADGVLTPGEAGLLDEWLARIQDQDRAGG
jgi:AcrR family transcriptional regulator